MHNNQILIGRNQIATSSRSSAPELSHLLRQILRRQRVQVFLARLQNAAIYGLATIVVSGLLLAGTYLFLTQLAEYGW